MYPLTLGNYAVHKPHGKAEEDEVMQVVNLEEERNVQENIIQIYLCGSGVAQRQEKTLFLSTFCCFH